MLNFNFTKIYTLCFSLNLISQKYVIETLLILYELKHTRTAGSFIVLGILCYDSKIVSLPHVYW